VGHDEIVAGLTALMEHYAKERANDERFGDLVIRKGYVSQPLPAAISTPTSARNLRLERFDYGSSVSSHGHLKSNRQRFRGKVRSKADWIVLAQAARAFGWSLPRRAASAAN
jgi:hypothetical protein